MLLDKIKIKDYNEFNKDKRKEYIEKYNELNKYKRKE